MSARLAVLALLLFCVALPVSAHKPSDSYLALRSEGSQVNGQWDIALRDLDFAIGIDGNNDGQLTWDEIRARHADIAAYAMARLNLSADGQACALTPGAQLVDNHTDGAYTVLKFAAACPATLRQLQVGYRLFADTDPQHKGLLRLEGGKSTRTAIFGVDQPDQAFALEDSNRVSEFADYVRHGVWHIWIGFDHILFLLSLLLPAVLVWRDGRWARSPDFRSAALDVLKIVSAFTLAHSITLTLAAMQVFTLPSRWVESAIAASVVVAALNNLAPVVQGRRWIAALVFGLIHGFGFASVLADLGLPQHSMALALVGFNVGVELGQLAIVAAFLPLAYAVRASWFYHRMVLVGGSSLIVLVASLWLAERALDVQLPMLSLGNAAGIGG
ncbi:MAG: HupE/UreJ family protein [Telluria sp.]